MITYKEKDYKKNVRKQVLKACFISLIVFISLFASAISMYYISNKTEISEQITLSANTIKFTDVNEDGTFEEEREISFKTEEYGQSYYYYLQVGFDSSNKIYMQVEGSMFKNHIPVSAYISGIFAEGQFSFNIGTLFNVNYNYDVNSNTLDITSPYLSYKEITKDNSVNYVRFGCNFNMFELVQNKYNKNFVAGNTYQLEFIKSEGSLYDVSSYWGDSDSVSFTLPRASVPLPTAPNKNGYEFVSWYFDSELTQPYNGGLIYSDTDLYAKYRLINYSINYDVKGGDTIQNDTFTIESETLILPIPNRYGYTFKGWYDNASFEGEPVETVLSGSYQNYTFYADWEINTYQVTFFVDGEVFQEFTVEHGTSFYGIILVDTITMQPVSVFTDLNMQNEFMLSTEIYSSIDLFSTSNFVLYVSLTYSINGELTTDLLEYNTHLNNLRSVDIDGYKFLGWFYDDAFTKPVNSTDKLSANTTIYANLQEILIEDREETFIDRFFGFFVSYWYFIVIGLVAVVALAFLTKFTVKRVRG